jgi:hypothetical protein
MVFAEDGAVSWEVIADPALTEADIATLDQINQVQPQPYYAALALSPDAGLASEFTALAANYHDEENARAAALAACEANRGGCGRALHRGAGHPARGVGAGPPAAIVGAGDGGAAERIPRASPPQSRVMAISPTPGAGAWARGRGRGRACAAPDCVPVVEG